MTSGHWPPASTKTWTWTMVVMMTIVMDQSRVSNGLSGDWRLLSPESTLFWRIGHITHPCFALLLSPVYSCCGPAVFHRIAINFCGANSLMTDHKGDEKGQCEHSISEQLNSLGYWSFQIRLYVVFNFVLKKWKLNSSIQGHPERVAKVNK